MSSITQNVPLRPSKCWQRECVSVQDLLFSYSCFCYFHRLFLYSSFSLPLFTALTWMFPPSPLPCSLVLSLFHQSVILCDALSSELFQDVVEMSGVGEAMARQVGAELCLMVDLVPDDGVRLSSSARSPN